MLALEARVKNANEPQTFSLTIHGAMAAALIPGALVKDCARFAVDAAGFHKMNRINTQPRRLLCQGLQLRRHSLPRCAGIQLDVDGNDVSVFGRSSA